MKLLIRVDFNKAVVVDISDAGEIVSLLAKGVPCNYEYGTSKWKPSNEKNDRLAFSFIEDADLLEPTPLIDDLVKSAKNAETKWLGEYTKRSELEKELAALKEKVAGLTGEKDDTQGR